jgi:hypothetical protein
MGLERTPQAVRRGFIGRLCMRLLSIRRTGAHRAAAAAALAACLMIVAGCSGTSLPTGSDGEGPSERRLSAEPPIAPELPDSDESAPSGGGSSAPVGPGSGSAPASLLTGDRDLIRTGQLQVEVADLYGAAARARAYVATQGGRISSEQSVLDGQDDRDGDRDDRGGSIPMHGSFVQMIISLPPDALDPSMDSLAELGAPLSRSQSTEDVTMQVVDLESRTASMRASIERIRALMDRAGSIADVVALESELSRREADLESMTSQLQALQTQTAAATLTLTLTAADTAVGGTDDGGDGGGGVLGALIGSLRALGDAAGAVAVGIAAATPFAALLALIAGTGWLIVRTGRRRRTVPTGPGGSAGASDPAPSAPRAEDD